MPRTRLSSRSMDRSLDDGTPLDDVTDKLYEALGKDSPLPQDVLYRVHDGAELWVKLTRSSNSALGQVTRVFSNPQFGPIDKIDKEMVRQLTAYCSRVPKRLGVLVLGCGTGTREVSICRALLDSSACNRLDVRLVDVSLDLVRTAGASFRDEFPNSTVKTRQCSFEHNPSLKLLRAELGDTPTVVLFIGNTLGNLDEALMLRNLRHALRPGDVILLETLLHQQTDADFSQEQTAKSDSRARFVTNPLRLLSHKPKRDQLWVRILADEGGHVLIRRYTYRFVNDESLVHPVTDHQSSIGAGCSIRLLEIKSMTAEHLRAKLVGFEPIEIIEHEYRLRKPYDEATTLAYTVATCSDEANATAPCRTDSDDLLAYPSWENLSIGVRGDGQLWLFDHVVEDGTRVTQQQSVRQFSAPGGRVSELIQSLATSQTGRGIKWDEAKRIYMTADDDEKSAEFIERARAQYADQLSDDATAADIEKALRAAIDQAQAEKVLNQRKEPLVASRVSEDARRFRDSAEEKKIIVARNNRRGKRIFSTNTGHEITSRPKFRMLINDGQGHFTFWHMAS